MSTLLILIAGLFLSGVFAVLLTIAGFALWVPPVGFCLLLALFLALALGFHCRRNKRTLIEVGSDEGGHVSVTRGALRELVREACLSLGAVKRPGARFTVEDQKVNLEVSVELSAGQDITETTDRLRKRLTDVLARTLGRPHVGTIDVTVVGFQPSETPDEPAAAKQEKA